jgi:hypothetical protein
MRYKMTGRYVTRRLSSSKAAVRAFGGPLERSARSVTRGLVEDEARQANFCFPGKSRNAFSNRRFFDIFRGPELFLFLSASFGLSGLSGACRVEAGYCQPAPSKNRT